MVKKTSLHAEHLALSAKMGEFAGYDMPLYYADGVMKEHEWVRSQAGLFDVSHMGQVIVSGAGVAGFFEKVTPSAFQKMTHGRAKYTVMTNEKGGIIDDLIVTRMEDDKFFAVLNAATAEKDMAHLKAQASPEITFDFLEGRGLIALQGEKAEQVLRELFGIDASGQPYMTMEPKTLSGDTDIFVSRLGYTGEDGFELSVPEDKTPEIWRKLLTHDAVKPIGLAARDSLRLEMGYPLYGHDIDDNTTPVEASLGWVMGKNNDGFIGADVVLPQKENGADRVRIGLKLLDKGVAREGALILDKDGNEIGTMTSGTFSPTLKEAIGMAYVPAEFAQTGTKIDVAVRGRTIAAEVCDLPFIQARTKSAKKKAA